MWVVYMNINYTKNKNKNLLTFSYINKIIIVRISYEHYNYLIYMNTRKNLKSQISNKNFKLKGQ